MKELDFRSFFLVLLQSLRLIIAVAVAMAVVFGVATGLLTTDTYAARCSMYIMNVSQQDNSTGVSANGLEASQKLVDECIILIKSNNVMGEVTDQLNARGFDTTVDAVRGSLAMTAVEETALLRITSTTADPELSQAVCEELMRYAPSVVNYAMRGLVTLNKIDDVSEATKTSPMVARNAILGGVFGLLLICALILVRYLMDNTIKDEKDLKSRFNVNVLGVVMDTTGTVDKATGGSGKKTGGK
jgi:capsular polysaccharide biosynthesis protein